MPKPLFPPTWRRLLACGVLAAAGLGAPSAHAVALAANGQWATFGVRTIMHASIQAARTRIARDWQMISSS